MIEGLGPRASDLLREAHRDVPSHAQRAQMWQGIESGVAVGGAVTAGGLKAMSGLTKVLLGVVIGGALSAGLSAAVLVPRSRASAAVATQAGGSGHSAIAPSTPTAFELGASPVGTGAESRSLTGQAPSAASPSLDVAAAPPSDSHAVIDGVSPGLADREGAAGGKVVAVVTGSKPAIAPAVGAKPSAVVSNVVVEDPLVREARLVAEARGALLRGDAAQALRIVKTARATPNPSLEPEELALQARALRDLGRTKEADATERDLTTRFPENSLAR